MILSGEIDVVNNVVCNWGGSAVKIENRHGNVFMNYVKNYLIPGEDSDMSENGIQAKTPGIFMYLKDNIAEHVRPDNSYPEDAIVNYRATPEPPGDQPVQLPIGNNDLGHAGPTMTCSTTAGQRYRKETWPTSRRCRERATGPEELLIIPPRWVATRY